MSRRVGGVSRGSRGLALRVACALEECRAQGGVCEGLSLAPRPCPVALAYGVRDCVEEGRGPCGRTSHAPCSQTELYGSIVGVSPLEASPASEPDIRQHALPCTNLQALETSSCVRQNWRVSIPVPPGLGRAKVTFLGALRAEEQGLWRQALATLASGNLDMLVLSLKMAC